jgi:hypothetical protein
MISDSGIDSGSSPEINAEDPPMSRTHQYRKVMKPLLERKRRARFEALPLFTSLDGVLSRPHKDQTYLVP